MSFSLENVLVIGAGTMGRGIAQWLAQQGCQVILNDIDFDFCQNSMQLIHDSWDKLQAKGKFQEDEANGFKNNLKISELDSIQDSPDLVIEAIVENLEIKQSLFSKLDQKFSDSTIFASNTSSIPITKMAGVLPSSRQKRFLGLHFFNPATIMKLVEIIEGKQTDHNIAVDLENWFADKGKKPALCADRPGFIVNRVARNFYGESLRIVREHDQEKIKEVDDILTQVGGFRMGPFTLMDLIGIDVNLDVTKSVYQAFHEEPRFAPHALQEEMVRKECFGKKNKKGFYSYE